MNNRALFEPDVIISQQYLAARQRGAAVSSEKRLMLAVMLHALHEYQDYFLAPDRARRALSDEAGDWFDCTVNEDLYSFENISETLGFDPGYLRRGIAAWRASVLSTQPNNARNAPNDTAESARANGSAGSGAMHACQLIGTTHHG